MAAISTRRVAQDEKAAYVIVTTQFITNSYPPQVKMNSKGVRIGGKKPWLMLSGPSAKEMVGNKDPRGQGVKDSGEKTLKTGNY